MIIEKISKNTKAIVLPEIKNVISKNEFDSIVKKIVNTIPKFIPYDEYFSNKFNLNFVFWKFDILMVL